MYPAQKRQMTRQRQGRYRSQRVGVGADTGTARYDRQLWPHSKYVRLASIATPAALQTGRDTVVIPERASETIWEDPELYSKKSPLCMPTEIKDPI